MSEHDHHHGLSHDLPGIVERGLGRRGVLSILGGLGAVTVVGCATQDDGFTSIFPAAYSGRWPHVHFEVYPTLEDATSASNRLRTSQLALPEDVCMDVYENAEGYEQSVRNLQQTSLETDMVFSDGHSLQLAKVTGSVDEGYLATLNVPV